MEKFSSKFAKSLVKEGVDERDAVRVAASEMEGAPENKHGGIESRQTYCHVLRYDEDGTIDRYAKQASGEQRKETALALGLKPGTSQEQIDREIARKYSLKKLKK